MTGTGTSSAESTLATADALDDVAAIVVHHRRYDALPGTVQGLLTQGVRPEHVLVVDNSEDPASWAALAASLPAGVHIEYTRNRGYGAAVNAGMDLLGARLSEQFQYVLVTSHEARAEEGTVAALRRALTEDPSAAVAGPTLVTGHGSERRTWSQGGYLARWTHRPVHHGYLEEVRPADEDKPVAREWLDGAFLLYRSIDLAAFRFCEDYFLYMEETDLHLRLGRGGRTVLWVPGAIAWQSSDGVPPFYVARNLRLLFARNDRPWRRRWVAPALALRQVAGAVLRRRDPVAQSVALLRGLRAPLPSSAAPTRYDVTLVNPLGAALRHYQAELLSVLGAENVRVIVSPEPSASGRSRISWLAWYLRILVQAWKGTRRSAARVTVVWPVLGYWDLILLRLTAGHRSSLVLHDPEPLVRAIGYGRVARAIGSRLGKGVEVIVHSNAAREDVDSGLDERLVQILPHPVLPPQGPSPTPATDRMPVLRVLGQYKADRDLDALRRLAQVYGDRSQLEIHGRGWPQIEGWSVHDTYVPEVELDRLMTTSDVVLIPYRRFYQSGIAMRCLERSVPVVGPAGSSLDELFGPDSKLLVQGPGDWTRAVGHALTNGTAEASAAGTRWRARCEQAWQTWNSR